MAVEQKRGRARERCCSPKGETPCRCSGGSAHSAGFTLATYVHPLDGDLGEPLSVP